MCDARWSSHCHALDRRVRAVKRWSNLSPSLAEHIIVRWRLQAPGVCYIPGEDGVHWVAKPNGAHGTRRITLTEYYAIDDDGRLVVK